MKIPKNLSGRYHLWAYLAIFYAVFLGSLPSWGATAKVDVIQAQESYPAGGSYPILFLIRVQAPWYIHGLNATDEGLIPTVLAFPPTEDLKIEDIRFPAPEKKRFPYTKGLIQVFSGDIPVRAKVKVNERAGPGKKILEGSLSYQACTSRSCLPPESVKVRLALSIEPAGTPVVPGNKAFFEKKAPSGPGGSLPGSGLGTGLWLSLLGLFLGGMALNLTPCVYPLIPITLSYFGGRSGKAEGKILVHGLYYLVGLAFTNSLLGLAAGLTGGMLGSVLQNPLVLLTVSGIMVFLALSFFGLWELRLPSGLTQFASRNVGGYFGSFFMGLTLGVVAAPCLGPFILGLLTYVGQKGDPFMGSLYFFVLSIGLGLPLCVLAVFSGSIEKLPRSGEWMVWVRKILGWILVGMAGYISQPLLPQSLWKAALTSAILAGAGLHLGFLERSSVPWKIFPYLKKGLGLILIGAAIASFTAAPRSGPGVYWKPFDKDLLTQAIIDKKPVIIDFYAEWCGPCKKMEKEVFRDPQVVKLSKRIVTVRVDLTTRYPQQEAILKRYRIKGVPTIIFINRRGIEEQALRVESFVGRDQVLSKMKRLLKAS